MNYTGPDLIVLVSTDYNGSSDPNGAAWDTLSATLSPGNWAFTQSGSIDISSYNDTSVYIAFKFISTASESATWEVDGIKITETQDTASATGCTGGGSTAAKKVTIASIQYASDGDCPATGDSVIIEGIVTATISTEGYFVQDNDSAWSGIYVIDATNTPAIGDNITITGIVEEDYGYTQLISLSSFTSNSSGNTVYKPLVISVNDVNAEMYEGLFVKVESAICDTVANFYGEWRLKDASGTCIVNDDILYKNFSQTTFKPTLNSYYTLSGVTTYAYGNFYLLPLHLDSIMELTSIRKIKIADPVFKIYPNPASDILSIELGTSICKNCTLNIFDVKGALVQQRLNIENKYLSLDISSLKAGNYMIVLVNDANSYSKKVLIK